MYRLLSPNDIIGILKGRILFFPEWEESSRVILGKSVGIRTDKVDGIGDTKVYQRL